MSKPIPREVIVYEGGRKVRLLIIGIPPKIIHIERLKD